MVWFLTTTHSGNAKRLKFFPQLSIHPRLEDFLPSWLERKCESERMAMFVVYGVESDHLKRYVDYFSSRTDYVEYLRLAGISDTVSMRASAVGLRMIRPTKDYGAEQGSRVFNLIKLLLRLPVVRLISSESKGELISIHLL